MNAKVFASQADLEEKKISWEKLSDNAYAYTAEGDPNTGVIIGDDGVMIIDATATPVAAQGVIAKVREITDLPIKYVVLTHYHAVRVLGASGYKGEGLEQIIASQDTYDLIVERGQQDMDSEIGRFPRLFQAVESVPGLTWPTITFQGEGLGPNGETTRVRADLDLVPDDDDPHAILVLFEESTGEELRRGRVAPDFKLNAASVEHWAKSGD